MTAVPAISPSRSRAKRVLLLALAAVAVGVLGYVGLRVALAGPPREFQSTFAVVDAGRLLRSSQPGPADLDWIKQNHGLKTIVVTRTRPAVDLVGNWWTREEAWARANGVEIVYQPCDAEDPPSADEIAQFLKVVQDPARQPVLVHCEAGVHRTGVYAALYGRARLGWSLEQALADLDAHGFGTYRHKRQKLVDVVRQFAPPATQPAPVATSS